MGVLILEFRIIGLKLYLRNFVIIERVSVKLPLVYEKCYQSMKQIKDVAGSNSMTARFYFWSIFINYSHSFVQEMIDNRKYPPREKKNLTKKYIIKRTKDFIS